MPYDAEAVTPEDIIKARVMFSSPTAGEDIIITIALDTAAPADSQFSVQLYTCDHGYGGHIKELNLCSDNKKITYDDIVPTRTVKSQYGYPPTNFYTGTVDIKKGETSGTLSFDTTRDADKEREYLIVSIVPYLDHDGGHPFYSLDDIHKTRWVDSSTPFVGEIHSQALWKTSILPDYSFTGPLPVVRIVHSSSGVEGDDVTFFIDAKPAPSSPLVINATVSQTGGFVPSNYIGVQNITIPTSGSISVTIYTTNNDIVDEPDGTVTLTLHRGAGYMLSSQKMVSAPVSNDDDGGKPIFISLTTIHTSILESVGEAKFMIKLSRPLEADETVTVPFDISGGTALEHYDIKLSGSNKGVEHTSSGAQSEVKFTGGVQTATLVLIALPNNNLGDRTVSISLGIGDRHPTSSGVKHGVKLGDDTSFTVDIVDDDKFVSASFVAQETYILESKDKAKFVIKLSRPLEKGETVTVPFDISGGIAREHYGIKLSGSNKGVEHTYSGARSEVVFAEGSQTAKFALIAKPNKDGGDRIITISLGVGNRQHTSSEVKHRVVLGDDTSFTVNIEEEKPISVSLEAQETYILENNGKAKFVIKLSRPLEKGETVTVPFDISGGIAREHWAVKITGNEKRVERTSGGAQSEVVFAEGSRVAKFVLIAKPNNDVEDRTITISLGTGDRHPTSQIATGGVVLADDASVEIDIIDDDKSPPIVDIVGNEPVHIFAGESYVDSGAMCTDSWGEPVVHKVSGYVNTLVPGNYTMHYTCTDIVGKTTSAARIVVIMDTKSPTLTLNGTEDVTVEVGMMYADAGAMCTDHWGELVVHKVSGSVDTSTPYVYTLFYSCTDIVGKTTYAIRTITVQDTTRPVLTLKGDETVSIEVGSQYSDAGAACTDNLDGTIAPIMSGLVNMSAPGAYIITYTCTDASGNSAQPINRTVQVTSSTIIPTTSFAGGATKDALDFVVSLSHTYEYQKAKNWKAI